MGGLALDIEASKHRCESFDGFVRRHGTRESVPTRLINPATSAIVVIMQRLHADDVAGTALKLNLGYEHLMLPMEYEPDRVQGSSHLRRRAPVPRALPPGGGGPRQGGDGLLRRRGQFQQRPTTREGGLFKRSWFKTVKAVPAGIRWVRYWDLAATADQMGAEPAYTVGLKLGRTPEGRFVIGDVVRMRAEGQGFALCWCTGSGWRSPRTAPRRRLSIRSRMSA